MRSANCTAAASLSVYLHHWLLPPTHSTNPPNCRLLNQAGSCLAGPRLAAASGGRRLGRHRHLWRHCQRELSRPFAQYHAPERLKNVDICPLLFQSRRVPSTPRLSSMERLGSSATTRTCDGGHVAEAGRCLQP